MSSLRLRIPCLVIITLTVAALRSMPVGAQSKSLVGGRSEIFVGSDLESYLRYLQTLGRTGEYPWTIRGFSPAEVDSLVPRSTDHPWAARYDLTYHQSTKQPAFDLIWPTASTRFNSAFPYGGDDGPIWAGRGLTWAIQAGFRARWRALSVTVAPLAFWAENSPFPLMPNGADGALRFGDRQYPYRVDRPQRFGDRPYSLLDPGESSLRIDSRLITVGISTADQAWGPADVYPFILGNNAAGFPHVFVGTGMPWNLWIVHLHARVVYGELSQSAYSSVGGSQARRFMSGAIVTLQPRGIPGLQLGAARFFHTFWPDSGLSWSDFRVPLEGFFKRTLASAKSGDNSNQLASVFFRWVLPHSGFEVYSEFGKDDHNWDFRDFVLSPDHASTHMLGFRKAWSLTSERFVALRAELIDMRLNTLTRSRDIGGGYYLNATIPQGHTERGQVLGADVTAGSGAGASVAVETYSSRGRWTVSWTRTLIDTIGVYFRTGVQSSRVPEVLHGIHLETLRFYGPFDLRAGLTGVYDFNRYFTRDAFNLNALLGARWNW